MVYKKTECCSNLIKDILKGVIHQESNSSSQVLWSAVGIEPSGNIKIVNTSDCAMEVTIIRKGDRDNVTMMILPYKERVISVSCIERIELIAIGSNHTICTGKFCLEIYYCLSCCTCDDKSEKCVRWEGRC